MNFRPEERTEDGSDEEGLSNAKQKWTRSAREIIPATQTETTYLSALRTGGSRQFNQDVSSLSLTHHD